MISNPDRDGRAARGRPAGGAGAGPARPEDRPRSGPGILLAFVALSYAAVQLLFLTSGSGLGYDEAVYATQFSANGASVGFHESRGWGTSLLVAPVVMATDSVVALRVYLAVVSALLLFGAFRSWLPVRPGYTVPLAAAVFASCWTTLFYGNQVMPNLYTALGTVALTGLVLRALTPGDASRRGVLVAVAVVAAVLPLFRPTDALVVFAITAGVAAAAATSRRRRRPALLALISLAAGAVVGFGQWVVEAVVRHGGVARRLSEATENFGTNQWLIEHHVRALDGPTVCSSLDRCGPVTPAGAAWLAAAALLAAAGVLAAGRRGDRIAALLPVAVGAGVAGAYLYYPGLTAPRYLLPVYGLWAILAADGLMVLGAALRRRTGVGCAAAFCALVAVGHVYAQGFPVAANFASAELSRADTTLVAEGLKDIGYRRPCLVYGWNTAQISYHLGCKAMSAHGGNLRTVASAYHLGQQAAIRSTIMVVFWENADRDVAHLAEWRKYRLPVRGWHARVKHTGESADSPIRLTAPD
ncbi:hypothetical protein ACFFRU_27205 [Planobispora longispora]